MWMKNNGGFGVSFFVDTLVVHPQGTLALLH
jgi:hypothetical protein